jgi:hypothetical protein
MSASVAASVVGIAVGGNALLGNPLGIGGSGGGGGGSTSSGTYDPYGPYRGQAAAQLNNLVNNPSIAMSQPGYQQTLEQGMRASQRGAAATGQLQSGGEQAALQNIGQNTFGAYYNAQLANLMQLSGASQNPAAAALSQQQAASLSQNRQLQGVGTALSGLTTLGGIFKSSGSTGSSGTDYGPGWSSSGYTDPNTSGGGWTGVGDTGGGQDWFSDIRMKENIELVGQLSSGLNVYNFEYKPEFKDLAGHGKFTGVMAQEVEQVIPEAVITKSNGYKAVKYSLIH